MIVQVKLGYDKKSERWCSHGWCLEITELINKYLTDESNSSIYKWKLEIISAPLKHSLGHTRYQYGLALFPQPEFSPSNRACWCCWFSSIRNASKTSALHVSFQHPGHWQPAPFRSRKKPKKLQILCFPIWSKPAGTVRTHADMRADTHESNRLAN